MVSLVIMSCFELRFTRLSLIIRLYHPLRLVGLILCPYSAVIDKFKLIVQHLHVRVKESRGERRSWVLSYFSNSVPQVLFV